MLSMDISDAYLETFSVGNAFLFYKVINFYYICIHDYAHGSARLIVQKH